MVWIMAEKRWSMGCKCRGRLVIATDATGPQSRLASGPQMHAAPQRRARQRHVMGIVDVEGIDAVFAVRERRMPKQALRLLAAFGELPVWRRTPTARCALTWSASEPPAASAR